ncbi:MAG TPA: sulfotransferase [Mycobacteriales bacterium]|nr:sulfotransferase [Mycobacteriales bacterium]
MLPNFVVVGVSRAGTTTVFNTLSKHPQILASSTKETRYFQAVRYGEPLPPLSEYEAYFRRYAGQPVVMECTPDYFYGGERTAAAIKEACDPRVAIILREPTSRLISFFQFMQGRLEIPADMTLSEYVARCQALSAEEADTRAGNNYTALWGGQYARWLPAWLAAYPDRCDIFFFDDLVSDPLGLLAEQCRRLGIDPALLPAAVPADNSAPAYRSRVAQRAAAAAARLGRGVLHRYPRLYSTARRSYEAVNKADPPKADVPPTLRRQVDAIYRPWNNQLRGQLLAAGVTNLPAWLASTEEG